MKDLLKKAEEKMQNSTNEKLLPSHDPQQGIISLVYHIHTYVNVVVTLHKCLSFKR